MKRLLLIAIITVCGMFVAVPASASAATCAVSPAGGENTPAAFFTNEVDETGTQGYHCNVKWAADVQPQYEKGGTWHTCVECAPAFHPPTPDTFYPADEGHNWSGASWTATSSGDTPACSYNWRLVVNFFGTSGFVFQTDASPSFHKNC